MRFLDTILEIVFPSKCFVCGARGADLCVTCLSLSPPALRECADWIFPLYDYRDPSIKKSLWLLKYKGRRRLARVFAEIMYEEMLEELSELALLRNFTKPVLIPIPLGKKRYRERGFNQAEIVCRELIRIDSLRNGKDSEENSINLRMENNVLIKWKETGHQAHIRNRMLRLRNIAGTFAMRKGCDVRGKNVILIDDILTTGATLTEAKKVLKQSGARSVIAFTIAH